VITLPRKIKDLITGGFAQGRKCSVINRRYFSPPRGFTLLEIILVVIIISIVVVVATPRFHQTLSTIQLSNTTQDIAQLMRLLSRKAEAEGIKYLLRFDLAGKKYYVQKTDSDTAANAEESKSIPENIGIALTCNPVSFYPNRKIDEAVIYIFKGKDEYFKDMEKMISSDFQLGQVQNLVHTEYVYTIITDPEIGRVKVTSPEQ